jgi:hypothetical protein
MGSTPFGVPVIWLPPNNVHRLLVPVPLPRWLNMDASASQLPQHALGLLTVGDR